MRNIFKLELRDKAKRKPTFCFVSTVQRLEMQAQSMEMCYANFFCWFTPKLVNIQMSLVRSQNECQIDHFTHPLQILQICWIYVEYILR